MSIFRAHLFDLPKGVTYLNGNSLGPLTHASKLAVEKAVTAEWRQELIRAWNISGWMDQPGRVGDLIAPLIGAPKGSVMVGDTLTIKLRQTLEAALKISKRGQRILSDTGNFPSDLYVAQGLSNELVLVEPDEVADSLSEDIDVLMLTEIDYRTGRRHDMRAITSLAQKVGIICVWDLAHSVGAVEVDVLASKTEFAVGCTYKYLNAGPGAPGFIYTRPDLIEVASSSLVGWMGHARPFDFELEYQPGLGSERWRVGTPPVLQMAALEGALSLWQDIDLKKLQHEARILVQEMRDQVGERCPELQCISPRNCGSHIAFEFHQGYELMQVLIEHGVIGDFRAPNILRFGFSPLYNSLDDVDRAVQVLKEALETRAYDRVKYRAKSKVT